MTSRPALAAAAVLGGVHAAVSLSWACGSTWLLETLGTRIVDEFSGRLWLLVPVVVIKVVAAGVPLLLDARGWPARRLTRGLSWLAAVVLVGWGGLNTVVANLVLAGVVPSPGVDRPGMIGHAWLWDPLFLAWGLALGVGLWAGRRRAGAGARVGA